MKIFKRACINLVRMPIRNLLYFTVIFAMVAVSIVCSKLYRTSRLAHDALRKEYPIVATVNPWLNSTTGDYFTDQLSLDELMILQQSDAVYGYNYRKDTAGALAEAELISTLPGEYLTEQEAAEWLWNDSARIVAVSNLMMEQNFFDGSYRFVEGRPFDQEDIDQCKNSVVISVITAEKYGLSVGDTLVIRLRNLSKYSAMKIVGIYEDTVGEPVTTTYVPLSYWMAELASVIQGDSMVDQSEDVGRWDDVYRIDFLLNSPEDAERFITYAYERGMSDLSITVNDKAYKIADKGLTQINMVTLFLMVAAILAGAVIIACITAYCRSTRVREAHILRCLGMRAAQVRTMFALEMVLIFSLGALIGVVGGMTLSDVAVELVSENYIAEMEEESREPTRVLYTDGGARSETLIYPLYIRFGESAGEVSDAKEGIIRSNAYLPAGMIGIRYEPFYAGAEKTFSTEQITVIGRTDVPCDGSVTAEQLRDQYRQGGMNVPCTVGKETGYAVGDIIRISRQCKYNAVAIRGNVGKNDFGYYKPNPAYAYLTVSEVVEGNDITVSMTDLELLCSYLGASSEVYRSVRYDECIPKGD